MAIIRHLYHSTTQCYHCNTGVYHAKVDPIGLCLCLAMFQEVQPSTYTWGGFGQRPFLETKEQSQGPLGEDCGRVVNHFRCSAFLLSTLYVLFSCVDGLLLLP